MVVETIKWYQWIKTNLVHTDTHVEEIQEIQAQTNKISNGIYDTTLKKINNTSGWIGRRTNNTSGWIGIRDCKGEWGHFNGCS
jgi:hypothetical protein